MKIDHIIANVVVCPSKEHGPRSATLESLLYADAGDDFLIDGKNRESFITRDGRGDRKMIIVFNTIKSNTRILCV